MSKKKKVYPEPANVKRLNQVKQAQRLPFVSLLLLSTYCLNMKNPSWPKYRALNPLTWIILAVWIPCIPMNRLCIFLGLDYIWRYIVSQVRFW